MTSSDQSGAKGPDDVRFDPEDVLLMKRFADLHDPAHEIIRAQNPDRIGTPTWEIYAQMFRLLADPAAIPKPQEPVGLGAVVVDSNDVTYVRAGRLSPDGFFNDDCWRAIDGPIVGDWKRWDQIDVACVLSSGVPEWPSPPAKGGDA